VAPGLDAAHQVQAEQLGADDAADAIAGRADPASPQLEGAPDALAVDLHQAVFADAPDLVAGAVRLHRLPQGLLHLVPVRAGAHVDEVDDHQPADVAQPQLPADLGRGLEVGVAGRVALVLPGFRLPELTSMAVSASVWSMTMAPPLGRPTVRL
jgi:hypothetical protein